MLEEVKVKKMFVARDSNGHAVCARCGELLTNDTVTDDHFIPKSLPISGLNCPNHVAICTACNKNKSSTVYYPSWYKFLDIEDRKALLQTMDYAAVKLLGPCNDNGWYRLALRLAEQLNTMYRLEEEVRHAHEEYVKSRRAIGLADDKLYVTDDDDKVI